MNQIESLFCSAIKNSNSSFKPEDEISWLALETPRGRSLTFQALVEEVIGDMSEGQGADRLNILSKNTYLRIFFELRLVAKYFAGEFRLKFDKPELDFEKKQKKKALKDEFYQIWDLFIEKWYFSHVYVGYGKDLLELDKKIIEKSGNNQDPIEFCKFRLYTKSGDKFYSIIAANLVESKLVNEERLVRCCFDEQTMFIFWWHVLLESIGGINRALHALKSVPKQAIMKNFSSTLNESILEQIQNTETVFFQPPNIEDIGEESLVEQMKFIDSNDISNMFSMIYDYVERQASKLGYVFKSAVTKKERTNSGENYANYKAVFNMQTLLLTKLNSCLFSMKKKFPKGVIPEDLTIVLSNQAYALGNPLTPSDEGYLRNGKPLNPQNQNENLDSGKQWT